MALIYHKYWKMYSISWIQQSIWSEKGNSCVTCKLITQINKLPPKYKRRCSGDGCPQTTTANKMRLTTLLLAAIACLYTVFAENQLIQRKGSFLEKKSQVWNFAKSCNGPRCGCWSDGCWQQIQTCFGLDCYLYQCFGPNCGCPSDNCIRCLISPH